jgi:hypothetical protein
MPFYEEHRRHFFQWSAESILNLLVGASGGNRSTFRQTIRSVMHVFRVGDSGLSLDVTSVSDG